MSFNVVYIEKDGIKRNISNGSIPKESLILTTDKDQSEAYYYDDAGKLKYITKKTSFESLLEAQIWVAKYDYKGEIISIFEKDKWMPYIVGADNRLSAIHYEDYTLINGGNA